MKTKLLFGNPYLNFLIFLLMCIPFIGNAQLTAGDVIISGFQCWNTPSGQDPGEFIELFNTTDATISLENIEIISRTDNNSDGVVEVDWQLAGAPFTGKSIAARSFFLVGESGVSAPGGLQDLQVDMDLATGEGGSTERAISYQLLIDGTHMDYIVYGRHDGSLPTGEIPPGDISFGGTYPRLEVIRNTQGSGSFIEGLIRRETASALFAGYDALGYYTDEDALGDGYPNGIWTSPHDETYGTYEARNSLSPVVNLPQMSACEDFESFTSGSNIGSDSEWYDGGSGPIIGTANGVSGSQGLGNSGNIFTWIENGFNWNDPDFLAVILLMDFETNGSGEFDDDRIGWMITNNSASSSNIFGVQLDPGDNGLNIEGYWDGVTIDDIRLNIVDLPSLSNNTWYRLEATITKLTASSASIDVWFSELDGSGNPIGTPITGSIANTATLGDDEPNSKYFTPNTVWPAYKNHSGTAGNADNACFEVITSGATTPAITITGTPLNPFISEPGVTSDEQIYSVEGTNLSDDIMITAPLDFEVSTTSTSGFGPSVVLPQSGGIVSPTTIYVRFFRATGGASAGDITHASTDAINKYVSVSGNAIDYPDYWVAYNDLIPNASTNPVNVTEYDYTIIEGVLTEYLSGQNLPVTITGDTIGGWDPHDNGGNITNTSSDAYLTFNNVVDLSGVAELDQADWDNIITFDNLDPTKEYTITLTSNRDNTDYTDERFTIVTIQGAATATNASSTGVIVYSNESVSFSVGYNTENGYVAKWTNVTTGPDGSFSVLSEWDDTQPGTKGYAMSAFKLELPQVVTDPPDPPSDLTVLAVSDNQIDLSWTDNADNEANFEIERSLTGVGGPYSLLTTIPADSESYSDSGLDPNTEYCYQVRAANALGNSTYTNTDCATTLNGPAIIVFQDGLNGYAGTEDTYIQSNSGSDNSYGNEEYVTWDGEDAGDAQHGLIRFDNIYGLGTNQIPPGYTIISAKLEYFVFDLGSNADVHEVLIEWEESDTWNSFGDDPGPISGIDYNSSSLSEQANGSAPVDEFKEIDVTESLSAWSENPIINHGWIFNPAGTSGVGFRSSEYVTAADRPKLTIEYVAPTDAWVAFNDMNGEAGDNNAVYVTKHDYNAINSPLVDSITNIQLPVTVTGSYNNYDPKTSNGGQANSGTDAGNIFGVAGSEIVDLTLPIELDENTWYNIITFDNLDPTKIYDIILTSNRNDIDYVGARFTRVTIEGAVTFTNSSSVGVVVNSEASVSFSTGYNTDNGYVARWTNVSPGVDGSFSIKSEWDNTQGSGIENVKGYAMGAFRLAEIGESTLEPPDQPTLIAPMDLATGVELSPELSVNVTDPNEDDMNVTFYGRAVVEGESFPPFVVVPIPDSQKYSGSLNGGSPDMFYSQTQWIADNKDLLNIAFVAHEGDIVEHAGTTSEWEVADAAMSILESVSLPDGIPYSVTPGNHDTPTSLYNDYFGSDRFEGRSYYGGHYGSDNDNNYCFFNAGGMDFIVLSLEYSPNSSILSWADGILSSNSDKHAIVVSHYILEIGENATFSSAGQNIYDALKGNPNLFLMLCGHKHGEGMRTDTYDGNTVYTLLADYQTLPNGGNGWFRYMEFVPDNNEINVKTYSPWLDQYGASTTLASNSTSEPFTIPFDMDGSGPFEIIGTDYSIASGMDASIIWPDLLPNITYEWYVEIFDGYSTTTSPIWSFSTNHDILELDLTVFLEGPFNGSTMNTDLNSFIPLDQPFNVEPWWHDSLESVTLIPSTDIVDWILVELRDAPSPELAIPSSAIARQAAFLRNDGKIVDLDGNVGLSFEASYTNNLYVVIYHRNHLGIMSATDLIESGGTYQYDFSTGEGQVHVGTLGHKELVPNLWGMTGGDSDTNGKIELVDKTPGWDTDAGEKGYLYHDNNLDSNVDNKDKNDIWLPNLGEETRVPQ